jgi:hypothetical protein
VNTIKVGLCFLDMDNKPLIVRPLESNWSVELGGDIRVTEESYRKKVRDEIARVLSDQIKMEIKPDILKKMLEEIEERRTCFDCGQKICKETIEKHPDTELCEECIECE